MTEAQWTNLLWSTVFNGPVVAFAVVYLWRHVISYRNHRDARALRGATIAFALLAAVVGGWARGLSNIANDAPLAQPPFRILVFACLVITGGALLSVLRGWYRR